MRECNVIIVEDDEVLLANSVEVLQLEGFNVRGVTNAFDFFQLLAVKKFDVAVVDLGLPDCSGLDIVSHLRVNTDMGIIILTARETIKDKISGYDSGADHYFVKPVDSRELIASIKSLAKRLIKPNNIGAGKWFFDSKSRQLHSPLGVAVELTLKEQSFIEILSENNGNPVTRMQLLHSLNYSTEGPYGARALDVMIVRLRKKIKNCTSERLPVKTVHGFGFAFDY